MNQNTDMHEELTERLKEFLQIRSENPHAPNHIMVDDKEAPLLISALEAVEKDKSCMYCEKKLKQHEAIILCKECTEEENAEPYFNLCDVEGCENEECSGGRAWRETGYWSVCSDHSKDNREGRPQPKMKQASIDREKKRDKKTGYLST